MKTVYTLTEAQFRVLVRIEGHLQRDPTAHLGVILRRGCASDLEAVLTEVNNTATVQVESHDRQGWQGDERRKFDRRTDTDSKPAHGPERSAAIRKARGLPPAIVG